MGGCPSIIQILEENPNFKFSLGYMEMMNRQLALKLRNEMGLKKSTQKSAYGVKLMLYL